MLVYGSYIHTSGKSGGELLTLFDSFSYDGVRLVYWSYIHTSKLVTEFDSYSEDGVSAVIGVQHTEVPNQGASW